MITTRNANLRIISIILVIASLLVLFYNTGVAYAISVPKIFKTSDLSEFDRVIKNKDELDLENNSSQPDINKIVTDSEKQTAVDIFKDELLEDGHCPTISNFKVNISDTWVMPCKYKRVSSEFGYRIHPITGKRSLHEGIDLANAVGTEIYAAKSGVVEDVGYNDSMGNFVLINHGNGFKSIYMHLTKYCVKQNQNVETGELIGYMGSTGESTGSHLHFGISKNGQYVNPRNYVYFLNLN